MSSFVRILVFRMILIYIIGVFEVVFNDVIKIIMRSNFLDVLSGYQRI